MGIATAVIANAKDYQRVLNTRKPVFMLFVSQHCPACGHAGQIFERIADGHTEAIDSLILDTAHTPRHPDVTGTPTLLIFKHGKLVEKHKGFGPWEDQEHYVQETFKRYAPCEPKARISPPTSTLPYPTRESRHPSHR